MASIYYSMFIRKHNIFSLYNNTDEIIISEILFLLFRRCFYHQFDSLRVPIIGNVSRKRFKL